MTRAAWLALLLGVLLHGCGSSSSSSKTTSTDWIKCKSIDDCTGVGEATACTTGYCVDATGARVSLTPALPPGGLSPCNPLSGRNAATIEYVADIEDGTVLVVTHPAGAGDSTGVRAFFGQPPRLDERHVIDAELVVNGNGQLTFAVGMSTYTANFAWVTDNTADGGVTGHPDLGAVDEGNDMTASLTVRWPTPVALPGYSFTCL